MFFDMKLRKKIGCFEWVVALPGDLYLKVAEGYSSFDGERYFASLRYFLVFSF